MDMIYKMTSHGYMEENNDLNTLDVCVCLVMRLPV